MTSEFLRTDRVNSALEQSISRERLDKYLQAEAGNLDRALALYEKNTRLAEAFFTPLQSIEVCLRNKLHEQMCVEYGRSWLDDPTVPLNHDARIRIADARSKFQAAAGPPSVGQLIAELHFAFWVSLLGRGYDANIWRRALYKAFLNQCGQPRSKVHSRFNAIRRFRNRVAHHEPIFHTDLVKMHREIIEGIGWMCTETSAWALHNSRFPSAQSSS